MELRQQQRVTQRQSLTQKQIISPKMILANKLLQLPTLELQQEVAFELEQNPALELMDGALCPRCRSRLTGAACYSCGFAEARPEQGSMDLLEMGRLLTLARSAHENGMGRKQFEDEASMDKMLDGATKSQPSLAEQLLSQFRLATSCEKSMALAEEVVLYIGEKGFLVENLATIALQVGRPEEEVQKIIEQFKNLPPYGLGSMTPKEALLCQLDNKNPPEPLKSNLDYVLKNHMADLGKDSVKTLMKELNLQASEARETLAWLRRELHPFPGYLLTTHEDERASREIIIQPNVVIRQDKGKFVCEMAGENFSHLKINKSYERLYKQLRAGKLSDMEKDHVREYFTRAKQFMEALHQRERTIIRISKKLTEMQRDFLLFGYKSLKQLTRVELAKTLELHEATVSRATQGKYVQIPSGEVLSFDIFFNASLGPKEYIRDLISGENPLKPYSDQELMAILKQKDIILARRTVAKYREELQILPAFLRKRS